MGIQRWGKGGGGRTGTISGETDCRRAEPGGAVGGETRSAGESQPGRFDAAIHAAGADHDELNRVYDAVNQIQDVRLRVLAGLKRRLPENASAKAITESGDELEKKLMAVRDEFVNLTISANEDSVAYPPQLDARLAFLAMGVGSADAAPTAAEQLEFDKLKRQSGELLGRWDDLQRRDFGGVPKADRGRKFVYRGSTSGG